MSCTRGLLQGHAGTVPMPLRRDPLAAAAEAIAMIEHRCGGGRYPDAQLQGRPAVSTAAVSCFQRRKL